MKRLHRKATIYVIGVLCLFFVTHVYGANPDSVIIPGDLKIEGLGNALVFPDGTSQYSATATGPAGPPNSLSIGTVQTGAPGSSASASITGTPPSQTLNLTIPQGPAGTPGACSSLQYLWRHMTTVTSYPATTNGSAYITIKHMTNLYDTTGIVTGWVYDIVNGTGTSPTSAGAQAMYAYYTQYDSHNNATAGYIYSNPAISVPGGNPATNNTFTFIASYTYNDSGYRIQRVRTWYSNGTVYRVQTTNYGAHDLFLNDIYSYPGNGSQYTDTYSNTSFDANGYPTLSSLTTTDASGKVISTGSVLYEFEQRCSGP